MGYSPWGAELNPSKGLRLTQGLTSAATAPFRLVIGLGIREYINDC